MTKVYPNGAVNSSLTAAAAAVVTPEVLLTKPSNDAVVLTVWKKSLLFNCDGFTVYDDRGNLVFRVDNYLAGSKGEIVLMDASGKSVLTIRRKRLSLGDNWLVYEGEMVTNPKYSARKHVNLLKNKTLAHMTSVSDGNRSPTSSSSPKRNVIYEIEGSYSQRCCVVYDDQRRRVAEIQRKESPAGGVAFGLDVFRLIVRPQIDVAVAMALVILLDQMFGSSASRLTI